MQIKIGNKLFSTGMFFFFLLIAVYSFITNKDELSGDGIFSVTSIMKYGTLFLCILTEAINYYSNKIQEKKILLRTEFKNFEWYFFILALFTLILSIGSFQFSLRIVQTFIFVFFPMIYAFLVINNWTLEQIKTSFKIGLIVAFTGYLISKGIGFSEIISNLTNITYQNTNSNVLESSTFALLALGFSGYFCYFNKGLFWKILSVLFVIMTFKRQITLTAIVLLILGFFAIKKRKVNLFVFIFASIILIVFAFAYYHAIEPQNILNSSQMIGIDLRDFSTNRTDRLNWLSHSNFVSYGFGSSTDYMYKTFDNLALEMDIVQLFVEMGPVAIVAFISFYLLFSKGNFYVFVFMYLLLINSTLSSGMASTFAWIIILIGMAAILKTSNMNRIEL